MKINLLLFASLFCVNYLQAQATIQPDLSTFEKDVTVNGKLTATNFTLTDAATNYQATLSPYCIPVAKGSTQTLNGGIFIARTFPESATVSNQGVGSYRIQIPGLTNCLEYMVMVTPKANDANEQTVAYARRSCSQSSQGSPNPFVAFDVRLSDLNGQPKAGSFDFLIFRLPPQNTGTVKTSPQTQIELIEPEIQLSDNQNTSQLNQEVADLKVALETLQNQVETLHQQSQAVQIGNGAYLEQNIPNPFKDRTEIKYYLPQSMPSATLEVVDLSGRAVKTYRLNGSGNGSISLEKDFLGNGNYRYVLKHQGRVLDSKQMLIMR